MNKEHTPGPWKVFQHMDELVIVARASVAEKNLANIINTGGKSHHANADLIAAAPDLLEALEEALPGIEELNGEFQDGWQDTIDRIKDAIKKAHGL